MKIIQLLQQPQLRGAEIFACQLSDHLIKQGNEVLLVTIFKGDSELPFSGRIINLGRPLSKRFVDPKGWKSFKEIILEFEPDIVQANASDTLKFAVSSKLFYSWPQPIIFRNASKMGDYISSKPKFLLNKFYVSQTDFTISVSKECEIDFIKTFNYPKDKINTVEVGVEETKLSGIPADLKEIFSRGPVISHIGGFVHEKNHEVLIDIFYEIYKEFPEAQLLLIGKGILQEDVREKVNALHLSKNVHFLNYRNDVLNIIHSSKVFILPSAIEGLPAVILEAMYCETPVIAFNVGGVGEVVIDQETGWLIPKADKLFFATTLKKILCNKAETTKMVSAAKKMVINKFLNDKIAKRFFKTYEKCLRQN